MFVKCSSHPTVYRIEKPFIRIKGLASVAASLSGHSSPLPEDWMICDNGLPHFISAIKGGLCGNVRDISVVHDLEVLQIFQIGPPPTLHFSYKVEQFLPVLNLHFFLYR